MTVEARFNLQLGVPEDKRYPATDYSSDGSALDNFLLEQARIKRQTPLQREDPKRLWRKKQVQEEIKTQTAEYINKTINDIISSIASK